MAVTCDTEHKFELCVQLGDYRTAYNLAKDMQVGNKPSPNVTRGYGTKDMQVGNKPSPNVTRGVWDQGHARRE